MKCSVPLTLVLFGSLLVVPSAGARVKTRDAINDLTPPDTTIELTTTDTTIEATEDQEAPEKEEFVFPCFDWETLKAGKKEEHNKEKCSFTNYYKDVDVTSAQELHEKIKGQTILPYSAFESHNPPKVNEERAHCTDVWQALEFLDQSDKTCGPENELSGPCDENKAKNVDLLYSKHPVEKSSPSEKGPVRVWNREHVWPKSYGASCKKKRKDWKKKCKKGKCKYVKCTVQKKYTMSNGPFTDLHHLFPSHTGVNSDRGSQYFQQCGKGMCNYEHHKSDGYTAEEEDAGESIDDRTFWQPPNKSKGVVARSMLYMALRYHGEEANTFDLTLTDHPSYCTDALGKLSSLLKWHKDFPATQAEKDRNDKACWLQGNRNPFVDLDAEAVTALTGVVPTTDLAEKLFGGDTPSEKLVSPGGACPHKSPRAHDCATDPDVEMENKCLTKPKPECKCGPGR